METVTATIAAFNKKHGWFIEKGAEIVLPDRQQLFVVTALKFLPQKDRSKPRVLVEWTAHCCQCGEVFSFETRRKPKYLTRTCASCRGTLPVGGWKRNGDTLVRKQRTKKMPKGQRIGSGERAVLDALTALSYVQDTVQLQELVEEAVRRVPPPANPESRDQRKYNVQRAVAGLKGRGLLPAAISGGTVVFL